MIPLPKLDDRKWDDLVREAIDLIPKYCPESQCLGSWHNADRIICLAC